MCLVSPLNLAHFCNFRFSIAWNLDCFEILVIFVDSKVLFLLLEELKGGLILAIKSIPCLYLFTFVKIVALKVFSCYGIASAIIILLWHGISPLLEFVQVAFTCRRFWWFYVQIHHIWLRGIENFILETWTVLLGLGSVAYLKGILVNDKSSEV